MIAFAFLLAGCGIRHEQAGLTADQARSMAVQLANDKAAELYGCRPFHDNLSAHFAAGCWRWTTRQGAGYTDFQATVELAADGSTNHVEVQWLDSRNRFTGF